METPPFNGKATRGRPESIFYTGTRAHVPSRSVSPLEVDTPSIDHEIHTHNTLGDLSEITAQNPVALMELDMDCNVKFLSKIWETVVGTKLSKIVGRPLSNIIVGEIEDKQVFNRATDIMMTDDETYRVRFVVSTNLQNASSGPETTEQDTNVSNSDTDSVSLHSENSSITTDGGLIELVAQGVLIHDQKRQPSHSMWIVKPWVPLSGQTLELPEELIMRLGFGINLFESYLCHLTDLGVVDEENLPPPAQELCRICEQRVPNWWLERHAELCLVEHRAEDTVQQKQENLIEHKNLLQNVLDTLTRRQVNKTPPLVPLNSSSSVSSSSSSSSNSSSGSIASITEYKGFAIPLSAANESGTLGRRKSVGSLLPAKRFPFKNLEILIQYCDEALKINPGELHTDDQKREEYAIAFSPDSERALKNLNTIEVPLSSDQAIKLLTDDTESLAKEKIEAIERYAHILQYVDRITKQTDEMILNVVKETIMKIKEDMIDEPLLIQSPKPTNEFGPMSILDGEPMSGSLSTRTSSPASDARSTPVISVSGDESVKTIQRAASPSYNSPRRPLSPGMMFPLSSIQRNSKSHAKHPSVNSGSGSNTPISSPLFLSTDIPSSSSSGLERPQLSPLLVPQSSKQSLPSIKDYEIIKPISKGAFGSVYLSKRKLTGEYFAIKVLKKADMVAKNQVTNVKAERAILMAQANSPYVAQLVVTFQSTNYLYLVMEYLNGGDLATLLKNMGYLPDIWARRYIAEVIVGVDDLHSRGIVHRDLKPDNLLIDRNGHIKLTDFGLSRMGLIRRQNNTHSDVIEDPFVNPQSASLVAKKSVNITPFSLSPSSPLVTPSASTAPVFEELEAVTPGSANSSPLLRPLTRRSTMQPSFVINKEDTQTEITNYALFDPQHSAETRKFVGTPDYLAPETVAGIGQDEASDWWSIGCILFEFLFGVPPFAGNSPKQVFENILHGEIQWPNLPPEEFAEYCSPTVKDLIKRLLVKDPASRLGSGGSQEIMRHPYFNGINWDTLFTEEASFVPDNEDPESTEYFDARGAQLSMFPSEEFTEEPTETALEECTLPNSSSSSTTLDSPKTNLSKHGSMSVKRERRGSRLNDSGGSSEFGSFQFRNLAVLEKQNKDVINRLKSEHIEQLNSMSSSASLDSGSSAPTTPGSTSVPLATRPRGHSSASGQLLTPFKRPSSPGIMKDQKLSPLLRNASLASDASDEYRHLSPVARPLHKKGYSTEAGSPALRLLSKSFSRTMSDFSPSSSDNEDRVGQTRLRKKRSSKRMARTSSATNETADAIQNMMINFDVLLCEPIPIHRYSIEKNLGRLGCDVVAFSSGSELIKRSTGDVKFDLIFTSTELHKLDCVDLVKLIKHTSTANSETVFVALTSFYHDAVESGVFDYVIEYPVTMEKLKTALDWFRNLKRREEEAIVTDTE
ncbi:hypothetical protein OGAPHI_001460 [Ogataea philodendri]|uniref:non-specific serine/threonine protein kinase n=2 Tax=Saccharomycotina TaxID=147537 RepID=A0A9P8PD96_9ASCO|nr:uncharacterized protein OGAPHI_001460 [Ogataea philodendri]KAH3669339.1 hypothetical protein OGAPHI_001460 [Ogataea philodendri]